MARLSLRTTSKPLAVSHIHTLSGGHVYVHSPGSSKQRTKKITVACNFCRCASQKLFWKMIGTEQVVSQLVNSNVMADVLRAVSVLSGPTLVTICHRPANGAIRTGARRTRASLNAVRRRDRRMRTIRRSLPRCPPNRCREGVPTSRSVRFWTASRTLWLNHLSHGNPSQLSRRLSGRDTPLLDPRPQMDVPFSRIMNCRISPRSRFLKAPRQQR